MAASELTVNGAGCGHRGVGPVRYVFIDLRELIVDNTLALCSKFWNDILRIPPHSPPNQGYRFDTCHDSKYNPA
jgi:hypothetical protein